MRPPPLIGALLADAACYDHPVGKLELIETHISWVILTGAYAYKIKKPVNLGFLDFSTLVQRRQDCLDELRLNRRLATDYYLGVVSITGSSEAPRMNGAGEILEYAVKMRQFPVDATLDKLAERGELGNKPLDMLAARLAHFHLFECARAVDGSPWGEPEEIFRPVAENFKILAARLDDPLTLQTLSLLQNWCLAEHTRLIPFMRARKKNGRVRECHGDLHLANLAWVDGGLVIFDCLEFSPALRWIDVISEVAFCYMDLIHRQYERLAARFLNAWLEATGDYQGMALLRYYAVYRALVRAKVAALIENHAEVRRYLQLAQQIASSTPVVLFITHGLSGSGKTTLSQQRLETGGMIRLRSDVERKRCAGQDVLPDCGIEKGWYDPVMSQLTYEYLSRLAEEILNSGWSVIVDAAFLERRQRDLFCDLARRLGVSFHILDFQVSPAVLRERVARRSAEGRDASEANLSVLEHQLASARRLDADETAWVQCEKSL